MPVAVSLNDDICYTLVVIFTLLRSDGWMPFKILLIMCCRVTRSHISSSSLSALLASVQNAEGSLQVFPVFMFTKKEFIAEVLPMSVISVVKEFIAIGIFVDIWPADTICPRNSSVTSVRRNSAMNRLLNNMSCHYMAFRRILG